VGQTNQIENQISVDNAGSIDPDEGISATIRNLSIGSFSNQISASSANVTAAVIDTQDLVQSMAFAQDNSLINDMAVANEGKVKASGTGVDLMIVNQDLSFSNSATLYNTSTTGVQGDITQSAEVNQSNAITNDITLNNKGSIEAGGTAVSAQILSSGVVFSNAVSGSLTQASGAGANSLERFENSGTISLQDHQAGDSFEISNTVGARNLIFIASGKSALAVDTFPGTPKNSVSESMATFRARPNSRSRNTNPGPGAYRRIQEGIQEGIPVVYVNGQINKKQFFLKKPVDTGLFEYDPSSSRREAVSSQELPGGGSHVLPHLVTNIEDVYRIGWQQPRRIRRQSRNTRVLVARGTAATARGPAFRRSHTSG
jgi:hypothetical protein